jgi:hypothetical protein
VHGLLRVFWEAREEEFEESIDILARNGASVNGGAVIAIRKSDVDRLVEELLSRRS